MQVLSPDLIEMKDLSLTQLGIATAQDFNRLCATEEWRGVENFLKGMSLPQTANVFLNHCLQHLQVKNGCWYITAFPATTSLPDISETQDYALLDCVPAMYLDLNQSNFSKFNTSLVLQFVNEKDDLQTWNAVLTEAFAYPEAEKTWYPLNLALGKLQASTVKHAVGYFQNEVVTVGTLYIGEGAVMLRNIATRKAYRQRGFARALIAYLLQAAQRLGFQHCFLESTRDGFSLYQTLGFQVYCLVQFYQHKEVVHV